MSEEVRLWRVASDGKLYEIGRSKLDLEERLQKWLTGDISILAPGLMVIGREVETDYHGYIDILCIDANGDLVVVELKRDKTPREIVAQALDYASWVADLSGDRIASIAQEFLGQSLEQAFCDSFGTDLPEQLNADHRMLIVGSMIDASSERVMRYLSDRYGVNINAATFQYFSDSDGSEYLARVFLMEPSDVELASRTRGSSKRLPNLTYEELQALAVEAGVGELYTHAMSRFETVLQKTTTRTSVSFKGRFERSLKAVLNLIPGESGADGLRYQVYKHRFAKLAGVPIEQVEIFMPANREYWTYDRTDSDYEGYQGYIVSIEEIDRLADALAIT